MTESTLQLHTALWLSFFAVMEFHAQYINSIVHQMHCHFEIESKMEKSTLE